MPYRVEAICRVDDADGARKIKDLVEALCDDPTLRNVQISELVEKTVMVAGTAITSEQLTAAVAKLKMG